MTHLKKVWRALKAFWRELKAEAALQSNPSPAGTASTASGPATSVPIGNQSFSPPKLDLRLLATNQMLFNAVYDKPHPYMIRTHVFLPCDISELNLDTPPTIINLHTNEPHH